MSVPQSQEMMRQKKASSLPYKWLGGGSGRVDANTSAEASWMGPNMLAAEGVGGWSVAKGNLPRIKTLPSTLPAEVSGMKASGKGTKKRAGEKIHCMKVNVCKYKKPGVAEKERYRKMIN